MGVKLIGFEKLEAKLTKNMDLSKVKATVKKNGAQLQKTAQKEAPVDTHYLQRSIWSFGCLTRVYTNIVRHF